SGSVSADGAPASQSFLGGASGLALSPDDKVYVVGANLVRSVSSPLPNFEGASFVVASRDRSSLYQFDAARRPLSTLDTLTGGALYRFSYDVNGRLAQIQDGDGNATTIEHDTSGNPTAITGPFGQRTALAVDANGFLSRVTNPAGDTTAMTYTSDGLL